MPRNRSYSQYTKEAAALLGRLIRLERKTRRWTASDLAERIGVSLVTLRRIENGDLSCSVGLVFEAAAVVGIPLFDSDRTPLATTLDRVTDTLSLMPQKIRKGERDVDDDF
ncbi:helix-turn-helix transcriptional regulator [bacterium]|nr:helix-turn-helix transcriptional regulator [bacterium]